MYLTVIFATTNYFTVRYGAVSAIEVKPKSSVPKKSKKQIVLQGRKKVQNVWVCAFYGEARTAGYENTEPKMQLGG